MFYSFGKGVLLIVEALKIDGLGDLSVGLSGASLGSAHCFLSQANSQELEVHPQSVARSMFCASFTAQLILFSQ